jgi:signal transduction histidine kinase
MKATYIQVLSRKIFLAFVAVIIILSISALFVHNSISDKLERVAKQSEYSGLDQVALESVLLLLHKAENNFQESFAGVNQQESKTYKKDLSLAFNKIDSLLKKRISADSAFLKHKKIRLWYNKKVYLSDKLQRLRLSFDSLLIAYATFNQNRSTGLDKTSTIIDKKTTDVKISSDTIKKAPVKKAIIKRLMEAIRNKNGNAEETEIRNNRNIIERDTVTEKIVAESKNEYLKKLQQLQKKNVKLFNMQRQLVVLNASIIDELELIIYRIKDIDQDMASEFKEIALKSYKESTALLSKLYLIALILVLGFATLLIIFIIQLNSSERKLRKEVERSAAIAQQKMDLLYHMSHEIRNPLTAIKGFLYVFSKSNMSPSQLEMLNSITLSSEMMLRTLNDTLDAAKMESSTFKVNLDPFDPDVTLGQIVEAMTFSAERKNLTLTYNFHGTKNIKLLGDSFRLKQIMTNLLSNAIKYTKTGGIIVNAKLTGEGTGLQVDVVDTGVGISEEQQRNLFSKYYQADSSKGQVGTGLGLFICKQLISIQKGRISVKSKVGQGTTFTFFIPYRKSEINQETEAEDNKPVALSDGISILLVDDNILNLTLIKKMIEKFNVVVYEAANGEEALRIMSEKPVNIVLTDLHMPVMDGIELLSKIRSQSSPFNQVPVVVVSGDDDDDKLLKMGFSGRVRKPFTAHEIINQLAHALKVDPVR